MHDSLACSNVMNVHKLSSSLHVARGDEGSAGVDGVVDTALVFSFPCHPVVSAMLQNRSANYTSMKGSSTRASNTCNICLIKGA